MPRIQSGFQGRGQIAPVRFHFQGEGRAEISKISEQFENALPWLQDVIGGVSYEFSHSGFNSPEENASEIKLI